jgi:hypothetical protein
MFLENATCLVKRRALTSKITVEAKTQKTRLEKRRFDTCHF